MSARCTRYRTMVVDSTILSLDLGRFNWPMLTIRRHVHRNVEPVHIDVSTKRLQAASLPPSLRDALYDRAV